MNTLSKNSTRQLIINLLFALFWIWMLAEKYDKAIQNR